MMTKYSEGSAASQGLANCPSCNLLSDACLEHCPRCQAPLSLRKPYSLQVTLSLLITALLLYIPANFLPIMVTEKLGQIEYNTILGGIIVLWKEGSQPIAIVVFIASVLVPIIKFIILFSLCFSIYFPQMLSENRRVKLYRLTEFIGRWSMVDIFVVAILVALIQLDHLLNVQPGLGAVAFAAVVIVTIFAANAFDPRILWDNFNQQKAKRQNKP
ncbi:paraquat-inducible protein A [Psychrobium sp. 1_MG-2023]|uniref:paraquat-inducible protein A n=1 Tax=Psychrobium sp. 1_MG-2023 TaxID=3062624 RepID=UPI000C339D6F|nr:paraquat-inducible protein A [Psychrobium sp. 1_MG-2023]MDP2561440.1 paraquat-inducible protein A [Psychrobium sp. 1_MG-2023]PKF57707.1 hypothetical protein CW748_05805 [Alteromonadales bacterium alter-6D02]